MPLPVVSSYFFSPLVDWFFLVLLIVCRIMEKTVFFRTGYFSETHNLIISQKITENNGKY